MNIAETATLAVQLNLGGNFNSGISQAQGKLSTFHSATSKLGGAISHAGSQIKNLITSPLGLLGMVGGFYGVAEAIKGTVTSAMDYQSAMEMLRTQTGATQSEVDSMSQSVLELAKSLPQGPNELAAGLYHVESAGYRGAKALDILRIAAEGSATGGADLESVTNALVGAEQSGVKGATDLSMAMGTLNAIVGAGNMRMQDLADAFGTGILATAKTFGVSMQSVGAAIATMTDEGVPAIDAATRLRMSINLLGAPTSKAAGELKSIGIKSLDLAKAMRSPGGITAAMELLRDHMVKAGLIDKNGNINAKGAQLLSRAFGGGRSSAAIMTLVGNMGLLEQKTKAVNAGAGKFGDAWAAAQQTATVKFGEFTSSLQVLGIKVGNVILPMVTDAMKTLGDWIDGHEGDVLSFVRGARDAIGSIASTASSVVGAAMDVWNSIPPELRDLLVKGIVADRTIKFLFGFDPAGSVISALEGGLARALGSSLAAAGLGKLFVQPVYVTNPGFGLGGGAGNALGAAEGAGAGAAADIGLGASIASASVALAIAMIPALVAEGYIKLAGERNIINQDYAARQATAAGRGLDPSRVPHGVPPRAGGGGAGSTSSAPAHVKLADIDERMFRSIDNHVQSANAAEAARSEALRQTLAGTQADQNRILTGIENKREQNRINVVNNIAIRIPISGSGESGRTVQRIVTRSGAFVAS